MDFIKYSIFLPKNMGNLLSPIFKQTHISTKHDRISKVYKHAPTSAFAAH